MTRGEFWNMVSLSDIGGCWTWCGPHTPNGHGVCKGKVRTTMAHRVSWMMANRSAIPSGMNVCHHCDNPPCVRPAHLFLGTQSDNMQDASSKGRLANVGRFSSTHKPYGRL